MNASTSGLQIGFRIDTTLAERIDALMPRLTHEGITTSSVAAVCMAIVHGIEIMRSEDTPVVSEGAARAGSRQFNVRLDASQAAAFEALQARAKNTQGRPVARVFVLRECLIRGLGRIEAEPAGR